MIAHWYFTIPATVVFAGMYIFLRSLRPSFVRLQLTFNEHAFHKIWTSWSEEDQARYKAHFIADYMFIPLYVAAGWLYGAALQTTDDPGIWPVLATWALPFAGLADLAENLLHRHILRMRGSTSSPTAHAAAGTAALIKTLAWLLFVGTVIAANLGP